VQRRLLIIGTSDPPIDHRMSELRDTVPSLRCEYLPWESLSLKPTSELTADLTIMLAADAVPQTTEVLRARLVSPFTLPLLAVLPEAAEGELVKLATQVADDFVFAPIRPGEFVYRVLRLLGLDRSAASRHDEDASVSRLKEKLAQEMTLAGLIGRDPAFLKTIAKIPLVARGPGPVLIVGETGTGKELCARAVHSLGPRSQFPFIPADCATLPDHLFESEVFGHVSGAFTDARRDQKRLVALAEGGTLFLDKINSLSPTAQSKLLRFLQERTYRPLGSTSFVRSSVNIVAATNCDLEILVRNRQFRSALFFRLNVFRLDLVPLRKRRDDIELLARHFVNTICGEHGVTRKTLAISTLRKLQEQEWPGNLRELYNTIQRAVIFSTGPIILPSDISDRPDQTAKDERICGFRQARMRAIESFERRYVEDLMRECEGNVSRAARLAEKERRAFGRLVKRYDIKR
jgi:DNA-binding NtrC family response regulator